MVGRNSIEINPTKPQKSINKKNITEDPPLKENPLNTKIPITISHYKINDDSKTQMQSFAFFTNPKSFSFQSAYSFPNLSLLRVSITLPDYWQRKSKHVGYSHTFAPTAFQVLARVVEVYDSQRKTKSFDIVCDVVNIDAIDEMILTEFLL